jgi:DNA-binding MarR family transcriptional regulator
MKARIIDLVLSLKQSCLKKEESIRKENKLSPAEYRAINAFGYKDKLGSRELSQKMDLSISRGSRVVDLLLAKKFINLSVSEKDRRCQTLSLTQKGIDLKKKVDNVFSECESYMTKNISGKEKEILYHTIYKIKYILEK